MRKLLAQIALIATIALEVVPAILRALDAFEKSKQVDAPKK